MAGRSRGRRRRLGGGGGAVAGRSRGRRRRHGGGGGAGGSGEEEGRAAGGRRRGGEASPIGGGGGGCYGRRLIGDLGRARVNRKEIKLPRRLKKKKLPSAGPGTRQRGPLPSATSWHSAKDLFAECQGRHSAIFFFFLFLNDQIRLFHAPAVQI